MSKERSEGEEGRKKGSDRIVSSSPFPLQKRKKRAIVLLTIKPGGIPGPIRSADQRGKKADAATCASLIVSDTGGS